MSHGLATGLCVSMLVCGSFAAYAQTVAERPRAAATVSAGYANSWAIVIGVNAYEHVPHLTYAVADAKAIADELPRLGFPPGNIRLLVDRQATRMMIERTLYREFAMGQDDRLFVYFAGHGETLPIKGGEEGFLLPVDADPQALPATAIAMDDLKRVGQRVKAKHVLFIMDACFSGFAATRDGPPRDISEAYMAAALREPVVQVLTAGRKGERAIEDSGHGLFTRRLLDGLRGLADPENRGFVTAAQLAAWVEPRVVRDSKGKMTPQYGRLDGEGQFVFVRTSGPVAVALVPLPTAKHDSIDKPLALEGSWSGTLLRRNDTGYRVKVKVSQAPNSALAVETAYGDGQCSGSLVVVDRRDQMVVFRETVERGNDDICFTGGTVQLKWLGDGSVQLDRFDKGGRHQGAARLSKTE